MRMAFMIPESIVPTAPEADRLMFDLLRRSLPPSCTVWYKSALELEESQRVPFLALGEEIGIVVMAPLDWLPTQSRGELSLFWKKQEIPLLAYISHFTRRIKRRDKPEAWKKLGVGTQERGAHRENGRRWLVAPPSCVL